MWAWLLTSTTYGTWLPGDRRGSVTSVRDYRAYDSPATTRIEHSQPGEACEPPSTGLQRSAASRMRGPAVLLDQEQAEVLLVEFRDTAGRRDWRLLAAAVMPNHFHLVVTMSVDVEPSQLLQRFKSYGSRALNERFGKPASGTWWTKHGSKRKLRDEEAVVAAVNYVLERQPKPLVSWSPR